MVPVPDRGGDICGSGGGIRSGERTRDRIPSHNPINADYPPAATHATESFDAWLQESRARSQEKADPAVPAEQLLDATLPWRREITSGGDKWPS